MTYPAQPGLTLSFAEIAYILQPYPAIAGRARRELGLTDEAGKDIAAAAGLASLIARGLLRIDENNRPKPTDEIVVVAACLSTADSFAEAVSWTARRPVALHIVSGPAVRLGFIPEPIGLFTVVRLDRTAPLSGLAMELFDRCDLGTQAGVVVSTDGARGEVDVALVRDTNGSWFISDTFNSPDKGAPTTREAGVARLSELLRVGA